MAEAKIGNTKRVYFSPTPIGSEQDFEEKVISFIWERGMSSSQRMKSMNNMHTAILLENPNAKILEVSRVSSHPLGKSLSAWELQLDGEAVELIFQLSKVYEGEKRLDYQGAKPNIKQQIRDQGLDKLQVIRFEYQGATFETKPWSYFYDWIYIMALRSFIKNHQEAQQMWNSFKQYNVFTDIYFNQKIPYSTVGPYNCQARSCAIFQKLSTLHEVNGFIANPKAYADGIYPKELHTPFGGEHQSRMVFE